MFPPITKQIELIKKGVEEIISEEELVSKLEKAQKTNQPLRIKQGFDPTAPDIHLGHTVGIRKLRQFQELGHTVVLIVGDYTAMVGDPSEKNDTRPRLSHEKIIDNARTYEEQFFKILDREKTEVHYNGDWFSKLKFDEVMNLASKFTIARILERNDFEQRYKSGRPISLHEFFYPIMQGYDSYVIKADVELGATEQKFNLLAARQMQKEFGQEAQIALTLPVIEGIDGKMRMSKSTGNYIGVDDKPNDMFGKVMSIPDELILKYFTLLTDTSLEKLREIEKNLKDSKCNPMVLKKELGRCLISEYHNEEEAKSAQQHFEKIFSKKKTPEEMKEVSLKPGEIELPLAKLLAVYNLTESNGASKRLIKHGAVKVEDEKISDVNYMLVQSGEFVVKVGKRKFVKFIT